MHEIRDKQLVIDLLKQAWNWSEVSKIFYSTYPQEVDLLPHTHSKVRLVIPVEGQYWFKYYNTHLKEAKISPGQLLFIDKTGVLINVFKAKCKLLTVIFCDDYIRYLISERDFENTMSYWYHTSVSVSHAGRALINCISELHKSGRHIQSEKFLLKSLIEFSSHELMNDSGASIGKAHNTYLLIKDYMHRHLHEQFNREELATDIGITPSHISKLFQRFDHDNFNDSLQRQRIERATQLLTTHALTIKETANLCGFKDTTHFIKIFRKYQETTPGCYRRNRLDPGYTKQRDER